MNFKEVVAEDINVFFDENEFAETHKIDGVDMLIIIDIDALEELKSKRASDIKGIYKAKLLFFVKKSEFGGKPAVDAIITVDEKDYRVVDSSENGDTLTILLGWCED